MVKVGKLTLYMRIGVLIFATLMALRVPKVISRFAALLFVFYKYDDELIWYYTRPVAHRHTKPL